MNIVARYIHGSADSVDRDVVYIVDALPSPVNCAAFCAADATENRNLAVVRDGVVVETFKGFPDEVNNALLATCPLHEQRDALVIRERVPRDWLLKALSVLRKLVMELRETTLRPEAHRALRDGYDARFKLAEAVDLRTVRYTAPEIIAESRKRMAFQLGQVIALNDGVEVYTKGDIATCLPELAPCLRREMGGAEGLQAAKERFIGMLAARGIEDCGGRIIRCGGRRVSIEGKEHDV